MLTKRCYQFSVYIDRTIFRVTRAENLQTKIVQSTLKTHLINFYLAKNEAIKCAVVERFQRTLMTVFKNFSLRKGE